MNDYVRPVTYALQHNGFEIGVHPEDPDFEYKTHVCITTYPSNGYFATVKIYKSDSITKGFIEINEFLADHLEFIKNNCVHYTEALLMTDINLTHDENNKEEMKVICNKDYKRKIITLCGSSRFRELFHQLASEYTMMGWIVLMPHCYYTNEERPDLKDLLVDIHRDMISMSDAILVVNKDGYIGESTADEIKFAKALYKEIRYFEIPKENREEVNK